MTETGSSKRTWFRVALGLTAVCLVLFLLGGGAERLRSLLVPEPGLPHSFHVGRAAGSAGAPAQPRAAVDLSAVETKLNESLHAARPKIEALIAEREQMPTAERRRIPVPEGALTSQAVARQYFDFRWGELKAYREKLREPGEARRRGDAFLTEYLKVAAMLPAALPADELRKLGEQAIQAGTSDLNVRAYYARVLEECGKDDEARQFLIDVSYQLEREQAPAITELQARLWLRPYERNQPRNSWLAAERKQALLDATARFLAESAGRDQQRFALLVADSLFDSLSMEEKKGLYATVLQEPGIDPWVLHMIAGRYYVALAWQYRGAGFVDQVTADGWKKFGEYLPRAGEHLLCAWQLHPEYPEAAAELITVAMAGGLDGWSPNDWFYEAVRAQLDYLDAYKRIERALLPRWNGSYEELLALAEECLQTGRWDTCVPGRSLDILEAIYSESCSTEEFAAVPGVAALAKRLAAGLREAAAKDPEIPANLDENWAFLACTLAAAEEWEAARQIFAERGDRFRQQHFDRAVAKMSSVRGCAYGRTGPASEPIEALEGGLAKLRRGDGSAELVNTLKQRLDEARTLDDRDETRPYFGDLAAALGQLERFFAGEWVELTLDENLAGWYAIAAQIEIDSDGTARLASSDRQRGLQLRLLTSFPPPFVFEAEFAGWPEKHRGRFGILLGPADGRAVYQRPARNLYVTTDHCAMLCGQDGSGDGRNKTRILKPRPFHTLQVKVWPTRMQLVVDGVQYHDNERFESCPSEQLTLGEMLPALGPNAFQCRHVRIRRLNDELPAESGEVF